MDDKPFLGLLSDESLADIREPETVKFEGEENLVLLHCGPCARMS